MEGGTRREVENEEARDREELFNIGACPKKKKPLRDISDGRRHEKRGRKRRGERPRGAI